jgi:AcrR family transcriptional regulator
MGLQRRGEAVRIAVLDVTTQLLAEEGLAGVRIADIAERSGVHQTSIYRRWGTRTALILDALSASLDASLPLPDTGSTRGDLIEFFTALAKYADSPSGRSMIQATIAPQDEDAQTDEVRERFWATRLGRANVLIERGIERGEMPESTEPELVVEVLAGAVHFRLLQRNKPVDVAKLVDLVLR